MTNNSKQTKWNLELQSPMCDITLAFILFQIIYIVQEAWVFRKSKLSLQYCLKIANQIAALKFKKIVLSGELRMT